MTYDQAVKIALEAMAKQRQGIAFESHMAKDLKSEAGHCIKAAEKYDAITTAMEILKREKPLTGM